MNDVPDSLPIDLGERSYPIHFAESFDPLADTLRPIVSERACAIVSCETVWDLYGTAIENAVSTAGGRPGHVLMPEGEAHKNLATLAHLHEELVGLELNRSSVLIALGGGIVGDVGGFAAATFMRGIPYVQVPTTLLSQVDSSVGGKTGVNLSQGKNLVGAFYQPRAVCINVTTLATLPAREFRAGYAEVIKYGFIADAGLVAELEQATEAIHAGFPDIHPQLLPLIRRCCAIKADVVARDEREGGLRAILNYGHTFAHAVETLTSYGTYVHGEAVAIGMHAAASYAVALGLCPPELVERQRVLLEQAGLPLRFPALPLDDVMAAFRRDKKATATSVRFVLPVDLGRVQIVSDPDEDILRDVLEQCMEM
jgi:3-dehydroquinate synthase